MFSFAAAVASSRWWSRDTVAVVTGANRGLGLEIARQLAQHGVTTVLTSRDALKGEDAAHRLVGEGLPVVYHQLEVGDPESAQRLAGWLKQRYGGVDILVPSIRASSASCLCTHSMLLATVGTLPPSDELASSILRSSLGRGQINNAAVLDAADTSDLRTAHAVFNTNYFGVKNVTSALLPLLRPSQAGARIINVSAKLGQLQVPDLSPCLSRTLTLLPALRPVLLIMSKLASQTHRVHEEH